MNTSANDAPKEDIQRQLAEIDAKIQARHAEARQLESEQAALKERARSIARREMCNLAKTYGFEVASIKFSDEVSPAETEREEKPEASDAEDHKNRPSEFLFINHDPKPTEKPRWNGRGRAPAWYIKAILGGATVNKLAEANVEFDAHLRKSGEPPRDATDYLEAAKNKILADLEKLNNEALKREQSQQEGKS